MPDPNNKYQENLRLLNNPRIQSLLKTIRSAEGATYNTRVGGSTFDDLSKKPGVVTRLPKLGLKSSAEGAYQFLNSTWDNISKDLELKDFSPLSQDIAAVELIKRRGALDNILRGDFKGSINKLSPEWASLPTSSGKGYYSGQKARRINDLEKIYSGEKVPKGTYESFTSPTTYSYSKSIDIDSSPIDLESSNSEYEEPEVLEAKQDIEQKSFQEDLSKLIASQQVQEPVDSIQQVQDFIPSDLPDPYNYIQENPGYNFEEFQKGGTKMSTIDPRLISRDNIPNINVDILPMDDAKNFTIEYIKSPKYKERLIKSGYKDVDEIIKQRLDRMSKIENVSQFGIPTYIEKKYYDYTDKKYNPEGGSAYLNNSNVIIDDPITDKKIPGLIGMGKNGIRAHELAHTEISKIPLNNKDSNNLLDRQILANDDTIPLTAQMMHDSDPKENKADLNALRFLLKEQGIYDAGTQDFTKEHLKKLKPNFVKNRLLKNYKEEDLIWLMNNIAQKESNESDNFYGQNGGSIESSKEFLQNWYSDRRLPDPILNESYQKEKNLYVQSSQNLPNPNYVNQIDEYNTQGTYDPQTGQINVLKTATPLVYTHEGTHAINLPLKDTQSNVNAFSVIGQNILPQDKIENQWVKDNYKQISNYQEVIPRLNSYRQLHGLKPDQVITPELIQSNRDLYNQGKIPFEDNTDQLYKMFQNEGLSNVLNKVVSNENMGENYFAQNGGFIPVSENGMYEYPNQKVLVPTNGNITMKKIEHPILGISQETGEQIMMQPEQEYFFKNTSNVLEIPINKRKINNRFK